MKILVSFIFILFTIQAAGKAENKAGTVRFCVHWYLPALSVPQAKELAGYDAFIGDPEVFFSSREAIDTLIRLNPDIKFFCYINPAEWFNPMFKDKPWSQSVVDFLNKVPDWWLQDPEGSRISFWPGMQTMNCRSDCPQIDVDGRNMNYIEFISGIFIDNILANYHFSGVLIDNCWGRVYWLGHFGKNKKGIDGNRDGLADDSIMVDTSWKKGMEYFIDRVRKAGGTGLSIIGNPGDGPFAINTMLEEFPCRFVNPKDTVFDAWYDNMRIATNRPGDKIFNARKENYFFTLCSAALLDGIYFSYLQNSPFEKKWILDLGDPEENCIRLSDGYRRSFQKATVFVNPRRKEARIVYKDGSERNE